jgi:hypothetical protein
MLVISSFLEFLPKKLLPFKKDHILDCEDPLSGGQSFLESLGVHTLSLEKTSENIEDVVRYHSAVFIVLTAIIIVLSASIQNFETQISPLSFFPPLWSASIKDMHRCSPTLTRLAR